MAYDSQTTNIRSVRFMLLLVTTTKGTESVSLFGNKQYLACVPALEKVSYYCCQLYEWFVIFQIGLNHSVKDG